MGKTYIIGFPRIGEKRELKFALEDFWSGKISFDEFDMVAKKLKQKHWNYQKNANIEHISSNDFSFYDNMLDTTFMLGAIPDRFKHLNSKEQYFSMARGDKDSPAMEMTKWFNTNYHYIVPELSENIEFKLDATKIINEYNEAKEIGVKTKVNIIGLLTYLGLSKCDNSNYYDLVDKLLPIYEELLKLLSKLDDDIIVQFDEPILVCGANDILLANLKKVYDRLGMVSPKVKIAVVTYFEHINDSITTLCDTPIWAIGLDFVHGKDNLQALDIIEKSGKYLIAGVVNGRNIWKNNIDDSLELLGIIGKTIKKDKILVSTSCSLLHSPYTTANEIKMDTEIKNWLSFAIEKLDEVALIAKIFFDGFDSLNYDGLKYYNKTKDILIKKSASSLLNDIYIKNRIASLDKFQRDGKYEDRIILQRKALKYDNLATTTIGSFPQTPELRAKRLQFKKGEISKSVYEDYIKSYIDECIKIQEDIGLDVLVHGEPERNDMVEFFAERLDGYGFSSNGWVQSYGSRCVKPPFIYGDVSRKDTLGYEWIVYAQSKTKKLVKGMLSGPVTMINWSFVREDVSKSQIATQIALALSDEVDDLQKHGIKIIQVDEAAFKEGYPLRFEKRAGYEKWAVDSFKLSVSSSLKETQIHTHMCYSEFNDIIKTIEAMDADVISIETARSGNRLLKVFKEVGYKQEVGPGIYDIHSPRVPSVEEMKNQIIALLEVLPRKQLWINPDCGLKTRKYDEVIPSLKNMVQAVKEIRGH
ncbi:MAG: 5-methyltetrahydropteroyltriglutamate--homocysteine S-methyltransferase [Sulfurovaceae bacterium]|nr:5-methyltetrahydropteroyltriglutamate--homocysteine S-methyltransferase [Sulfurovaceae bacterium]MDD5548720.1 5-methyltetrahydropteroyltriglutamate--homocysteine S-methyltransferase [Sulfurovaceae bacterium]